MKYNRVNQSFNAKPLFKCVGLVLLTVIPLLGEPTQGQLFRYINKDGVKVLGHSIPPEYVSQGYEVISASGKVIKVVAPAPTEEELELERARRALLAEYKKLERRYSDVSDIKAARDRRLAAIETSISIVEANISGFDEQLEAQLSKAADEERIRGKVSPRTEKQIATIRNEKKVTQGQLVKRIEEFEEVNNKFQQEIDLYIKGKQLIRSHPELLKDLD